MAAAEVIKRLSTRATAAEQMIQLLRKQVDGIRQSSGCAAGTGYLFSESIFSPQSKTICKV